MQMNDDSSVSEDDHQQGEDVKEHHALGRREEKGIRADTASV